MKIKQIVNENDKIHMPHPDDTLGVKRHEMPQVHKDHYPELFQYLKDNGGKFNEKTVHAKELKPVQGEFSDQGVRKMIQQMRDKAGSNFKKPIIVSADNYIIDGHHRWLASWNEDENIPIIQVSIPVKKLLQLVKDFKHTTYKDIYNEKKLDVRTPGPKAIAQKHNVPVNQILKQLAKGVKIELEHTTDKKIAKEIALDHLNEYPDYYDRLEHVED